MSLREKCMDTVRQNVRALPPMIRDDILEICRKDMENEIRAQLSVEYGLDRIRAALPGIVNDIVTSRTFGLEQTDHLEENPGIDRLLLDHVILAVELTIESTSNNPWANNIGQNDSLSEHDDSFSEQDDY
jgi:hypothetical protein